jgi:hypothetical protein
MRFINLPADVPQELAFVSSPGDFGNPISGVITLQDNYTYFITGEVDLNGARLVAGRNTTIIGGSSENCILKSTGLDANTALITSEWSLPMRSFTITHGTALNLDASLNANQALDWFGVNFTNCATVGTIKGYSNFIMTDCALLNSANMTFDGTIGTIGFSQCIFDGRTGQTTIIVPSTAVITRRFRVIYSSFVCLSGETALNISSLASIPTESYILDTVNFAGGATYLAGLDSTSNTSLFVNCVGIINTSVNGQLYMQGNATATSITNNTNFFKIAGTTTASVDNSKYTHSNNRLTCQAVISRKYLIQASLSVTGTANDVLTFGFFDSKLPGVRVPSRTNITLNSGGRAESVTFMCVVNHSVDDYLEVHARNTTAARNITVTELNFTITEI